MKKVLFVSYLSPVGSKFVNKTFEMAFKVADDVEPSVLLMKDSVIALNNECFTDLFREASRYSEKEVKIHALEEDVERKRTKLMEGLKVSLLSRKELPDLVRKFDFVVFV